LLSGREETAHHGLDFRPRERLDVEKLRNICQPTAAGAPVDLGEQGAREIRRGPPAAFDDAAVQAPATVVLLRRVGFVATRQAGPSPSARSCRNSLILLVEAGGFEPP